MKTNKASLLLPLLTIALLFVLSGCYTQMAIVDEDQYSAYEPTPIIIVHPPPIIIIEPPYPVPQPSPGPIWNPPIDDHRDRSLPPAGSIQNDNAQNVQKPTRDSGIQRGERDETPPTPSRSDERRTSGPTRGGR